MAMDSYSNRASSLFTTFTRVLFTVATLNHFTSYFYSPAPVGTVALAKSGSIEYTEFKTYKADQVMLDFDLHVDLATEKNWNVNQLYVFVVASYETTKNNKNEIIIFDKILGDQSEFKFTLRNIKNKYMLRDEFKETLAGQHVSVSIRYQVMPIFGLLRIKEIPVKGGFTIPAEYTTKGRKSR